MTYLLDFFLTQNTIEIKIKVQKFDLFKFRLKGGSSFLECTLHCFHVLFISVTINTGKSIIETEAPPSTTITTTTTTTMTNYSPASSYYIQ